MTKTLMLLFVLSLYSFAFSGTQKKSDTINRTNSMGEREGWWVISNDNKAIFSSTDPKFKEGFYVKGRKSGVWITYYEDGTTPRLIGEYADNRPSGSYFRFDRQGNLEQASAIPKAISTKQSVQVSNPIFSCKMLFNQRDIVAGQVFFAHRLFKKDLAVQFWVESSMETIKSESKLVDFSWLNANYTNILLTYSAIRTPKKMRLVEPILISQKPIKENDKQHSAKNLNYYYPPIIKSPRVANGLVFVPNGLNKLYTESSEIWIDGHFVNGQLYSGKVFIYDRDGVLLKVRIYKEGIYSSDGGL